MSPLSGVTVVVTRPAHQAENLCQLIEAAGGEALRFPVIEIGPPQDPKQCKVQLARLTEYDLAIFISANAVNAALAIQPVWPENMAIAAVGKATAQALAAKYMPVTYVAPEPYNSEALLSLPDFQQLADKHIAIIRGNGGREFLRNSLQERGAEVDYVECYQRMKPQSETTPLYEAWDQKQIMPIVVTSNQSLINLQAMIHQDYQAELLAAPLFLISERTATLSTELGFTQTPVIATAANDDAVMSALTNWTKASETK